MSNISDGFDAIKLAIQTLFPSHQQLTNPYDVAENTTLQLMKGWGIAFGPATNSRRKLACHLSVNRTISIPLTRVRSGSSLDTLKKETNEKLLLEDQYVLIKEMEKNVTVNNNNVITRFEYTSDNGIETVLSDNDHYIVLVTNFEMEYLENLNS